MIDWRSAAAWFPGIGSSVRDVRRSLRFTWRLRLARFTVRVAGSANAAVPWTVLDVAAVVLWTTALLAGGAIGLFLLRLLISFAFALGESTGHVRSGTFDRLTAAVHPYATLVFLSLLGGIACCGLFYSIHRTTIRKYRLSWSALHFRHAGWRTYGLVAALFVPLSVAGALIMRVESTLVAMPIHNPQDTMLTRGVAALPGNFALLFVLLVVVIPIAEETFFRGFLFSLLRRDLPLWAAASASALPFAALHGAPLLMPWFFFMGIAYALVVERTQSLYSSIVLHSVVNAVATLGLIALICNW
jgi:membrane protease YdiL (CAAX protease family)